LFTEYTNGKIIIHEELYIESHLPKKNSEPNIKFNPLSILTKQNTYSEKAIRYFFSIFISFSIFGALSALSILPIPSNFNSLPIILLKSLSL